MLQTVSYIIWEEHDITTIPDAIAACLPVYQSQCSYIQTVCAEVMLHNGGILEHLLPGAKALAPLRRAEHGVSSTIRDLCFSPAHQNKVGCLCLDCSLFAMRYAYCRSAVHGAGIRCRELRSGWVVRVNIGVAQ